MPEIVTTEFRKTTENSASSAATPTLSEYMNFRQYLADFYKYKKEKTKLDRRQYGYGMFAAAANIKSPNYLKMIIEGKRNLSPEMISKFSKALGHNKEQSEEFRLLVQYSQSLDPADRNIQLKALTEYRVALQLKNGEIDPKTWAKIPNWITWVIYSLVDQENVNFSAQQIKEILKGKASVAEIEEALQLLFSSGELQRDTGTGVVKKTRQLMDAAEDIPVALVRKLQTQLMYLGLEALYQHSPTERELGTLTLSLTKAEFEELRFKLRQMRKGIHKDNSIARIKDKGERIYQLNIQLFPLTEKAVILDEKNPIIDNAAMPNDSFL